MCDVALCQLSEAVVGGIAIRRKVRIVLCILSLSGVSTLRWLPQNWVYWEENRESNYHHDHLMWLHTDIQYTVGCRCISQFYPKFSQKTHHSSPVRMRYGVCFVDLISDLYSVPVTAVMYVIYCYIGRYNSTWLYIGWKYIIMGKLPWTQLQSMIYEHLNHEFYITRIQFCTVTVKKSTTRNPNTWKDGLYIETN